MPSLGRMRRITSVVLVGALVAACSDGDRETVPTTADATTTSSSRPQGSTSTSSSAPPPITAGVTTTTGVVATSSSSMPDPPTSSTTSVPATVPVPTFVDQNGFDDHTVPTIASVAELMALSTPGVGGQSVVKFTIPDFSRPPDAPDLARAHFMDGGFYRLHDEWYWFRLLNGQDVPGAELQPVRGETFATVAEIYQWARAMPPADLPLDLRFFEDRLYSPEFYELSLRREPRRFGVGSIVRMPDPEPGRPDHWLIELEYSDVVTPDAVSRFFGRLQPLLPTEVADALEWVVRSPQQDEVARRMQAEQLPFHDRVVRFADLVSPGTTAVYSDGVAAGRLLYVGEGGADLGDAEATDIVVTEHVPDWLPQASALITSDPQTPLAHVNLLARNRGIPNASRAGVHADAALRQAARVNAHAIVIARGSSLQVALITPEQYEEWVEGQRPTSVSVPEVDVDDVPLLVDLGDLVDMLSADGLTEADVAEWRPIIGGKSAGFLTLLATPGLTPPPDPLAITVRPYLEHLAPIRLMISAAIGHRAVTDSARARWLVLEGPDDYADLFPSADDEEFAATFLATHRPGSPIGDVLAAGGVRALIESRPIAAETLAAITDELARTYADYDDEAGLRFRSSSSVEDIEGFNGAGLYTSFTGFLHPERLEDEDDHDATIERAILRAWASYWSFEAFEERRSAGVDHLSGAMGLTVHARFDDDLELNNGVATWTYLPGDQPSDAVLEINVQQGDVEVTNPDPDDPHLPEVIRVTWLDGAMKIGRLAESTLLPDGEHVLDDDAVAELFEQTAAVAEVWRSRLNDSLPVAQRVQTVVLDFEFKTMDEGWPQLADDDAEPYPQRLVLRQVRSLEPGLRALPQDVRELPIPRDVLMRASLVESVRCAEPGRAPVTFIEVRTDPLLAPDMGHADEPLVIGPAPSPAATCTRTVEYASPRQALVELVESGAAFVVIG